MNRYNWVYTISRKYVASNSHLKRRPGCKIRSFDVIWRRSVKECEETGFAR